MQKQRNSAKTGHELNDYAGQDVLRSLRRIFHAVDRHSRRLARLHGLTEPQAICLNAIDRAIHAHPGQLAKTVSLSPPTVTGILDRLERRHLIKRERTASDKRQVVVYLTDDGRALLKSSPPSLQECFTRRLAELPESRQRQIDKALKDIVKLLEAEDIEAAPLLARGAAHGEPAGQLSGDSLPFSDPKSTAFDRHDGH